MGAKTAISEEQYLHTSFPDLDQDYVDDEPVERSSPNHLHLRTQVQLTLWFCSIAEDAARFVRAEVRLKIRSGVYRIPDFCFFYPIEPIESVPEFPPFVIVEILSTDDRMSEVSAKFEQYRELGVTHIWLADPHAKRLYIYDGGFAAVALWQVPELDLEIAARDIFR
jgi:Uma2 family endonuclease